MPVTVDYTPSSAAPALYGAALGAGQEQFRARRRAEEMQLVEMAQRERQQQRALQANLYSQAASQAANAQQAALDRQFRAEGMQFQAGQQAARDDMGAMFDAENDRRKFVMQRYESGELQLDQGMQKKLMQIRNQMTAIRQAPQLTPYDKQQKITELDSQFWDIMENPPPLLPGERQKSMQEKWETEKIEIKGPNGEIRYLAPDRSGAFREVTSFDPPKEAKKPKVSPTRTITTIDANGMPKSMTVPKTVDDILAEHAQTQEAERLIEQLDVPVIEQEVDIAQIPVGGTFQSPDGDYFERTPQGYQPIDNPMKAAQERAQARATQMAAEQTRIIQEAAAKKQAEEQAKDAAVRAQKLEDERRKFIQGMVGKAKPQAAGSVAAPSNYTPAEAAALWEDVQSALSGEQVEPAQPAAQEAPIAPQAATGLPPMPPVPQPTTEAEYNALPSGALYRFTDGRIMRKP